MDEWVGARPLVQACLFDISPFAVVEAHMSIDMIAVPATYDPGTHLLSYTPTEDLAEGVHDVTVFVLYTNSYTTGKVWMFRSDYENPQFNFVFFPAINHDYHQIDSENVTAVLMKPYDPQYHLDPANWRATHQTTGITYHPDSVTPVHTEIVILHFPNGGVPDKNPRHYTWGLGGKPGKPEGVVPPAGTDPPPPGPDPPWCNGPTIALNTLFGKNDAEEYEWHWWAVDFTPVQVPPEGLGTRGDYYTMDEYTYKFNPIDTDFSKDLSNQPWSIIQHQDGVKTPGTGAYVAYGGPTRIVYKWVVGTGKYHDKENLWCEGDFPGSPKGLGQVEVDFPYGDSSYPQATFQLMTAQDRGTYDPSGEGSRIYPHVQGQADTIYYEWFHRYWNDPQTGADFQRRNGGRLWLKIVVKDTDHDRTLTGITRWAKIDRATFGQILGGTSPPAGSEKERCLINGGSGNLEEAYIVDMDDKGEIPPDALPHYVGLTDPEEQGGFGPDPVPATPDIHENPKPPNRDRSYLYEKKIYFLEIGLSQFDCIESGSWHNYPYYFFLQDQGLGVPGSPNWHIVSFYATPSLLRDRPSPAARQYVNLEKDLVEAPYPQLPAVRAEDTCHDLGAGFHEGNGPVVCDRVQALVNGLPAGYTKLYLAYCDPLYHWSGSLPNNPEMVTGGSGACADGLANPADPIGAGNQGVWSGWDNHQTASWGQIPSPIQPLTYNECLGGTNVNYLGKRWSEGFANTSPFAVDTDQNGNPIYSLEHAGKAWCAFHNGTFGGDNFRTKACFSFDRSGLDWSLYPNGWDACKGPAAVSSEVWNWRKAWVWPTAMPPSFDPLVTEVPGGFDDGFVGVARMPISLGQDHTTPLDSCGSAIGWAHQFSGYPFPHPPPFHTPHHSGVDELMSAGPGLVTLGVYCGGDVHSFSAVGTIRLVMPRPQRLTTALTLYNAIHEMGHNLGDLPHPDTSQGEAWCKAQAPKNRSVMSYSCQSQEWVERVHYFSIGEIGQMRGTIQSLY